MTYQAVYIVLSKSSMLRSYLCDYSDAYIVKKGAIDLLVQKNFAFKNNAPFRS